MNQSNSVSKGNLGFTAENTDRSTILALDTSTSACSVALLHNGHVECRHEVGNNIHSKVLLPMVSQLIDEFGIKMSQLDAVAVGQGPGSFTGLRIGVGVAQGIAFGANCPMVGVSSLAVLAQSLAASSGVASRIIAGIDARMGEVYWAEFDVLSDDQGSAEDLLLQKHVSLVGGLCVTSPEEVATESQFHHRVGNAWVEYWGKLDKGLRTRGHSNDEILHPRATDLLALAQREYRKGNTVKAAEFAPVYVRNNVAKKSNKPLPGTRV